MLKRHPFILNQLMKKLLTLAIFSCTAMFAVAQKPLAQVFALIEQAEAQQKRKHYDSAFASLQQAEDIVKKYKLQQEVTASVLYNQQGALQEVMLKADAAHAAYMKALQNGRKYKHKGEAELALLNLVGLHRKIIKQDLPFKYPDVAETEKSVAHFPIEKVTPAGDSLLISILGGKFDGISAAEKNLDIFTHYIQGDSSHHDGINFISGARIVEIGNNKTVVKAKVANIQPIPGDIAGVYAQVPLAWRQLSMRQLMLNNLYLVHNDKTYPYHYRFYYYYADSLVEQEAFKIFQSAVKEVVEVYADDTLTNGQLGNKIEEGIFTGFNAIRAMNESKPHHLKLFLNFVNNFPGKYIGNNYRFSETYATWVISNTPLEPSDIKPYLLGAGSNENIREAAAKLSGQIQADDLEQRWFDEGMQHTILDNIAAGRTVANLLQQVAVVTKGNYNKAWNTVLLAQIEKRMLNNKAADSLLNVASDAFTKSGDREGITWVNNSRQQWKKANQVNVGIQSGHIFSYSITPASNPRYFATSGADNLVKIWDSNLGKEILTLTDHRDEVNGLHYSPNGRYMASVGQDSLINVYNAYDYSKMFSYKTASPERVIKFAGDNKSLVTAGRDSLIKFRNIQTGAITKTLQLHKGTVYDVAFHPINHTTLYSAGADSMVYRWDTDSSEMTRWYKYKGKALSVKISNNGKYMSVVSTDSLLTIRSTETHKILLTYKIHVFKQGTSTYYASESFSPDSKFICFPTAKDSFSIVQLKDGFGNVYPTNLPLYHLADLQFSADGKSVMARFNLGGPLRVYNFAGWDIKNNTVINYKDIQSFANIVMSVQFTKDDNGLVVLHDGVSKIDLRSGKTEPLYYAPIFIENRYLLLNDERYGVSTGYNKRSIYFWERIKQDNERAFNLPEEEQYASLELSPDNSKIFVGSTTGFIQGWNTANEQTIFAKRYLWGDNSSINKIFYDRHHNRLLATTANNKILIIAVTDGKLLDSIHLKNANYTVSTKDYIFATDENGFLNKYDANTLQLQQRTALNSNGEFSFLLLLSPDEQTLYVQAGYTMVRALRIADDKELFRLHDHNNQLTMMAVSHDGTMLATAAMDSKINLYNAKTGNHLVNIYVPKERNVIISDRKGYYLAPKNSLDAVVFSYNNNAYTFDQFDVQMNRPDIILKNIGRVDSATTKSFYAAYRKRLSKLGVDVKQLSNSIQLPLVRLKDKFDVQPSTTQSTYKLYIECSDNNYPLQSLQVLVNNSPVLGVAGRNLAAYNSKELLQEVTIPLARGNNSIKVFCTNSQGVKSLKESFDIISNYPAKQPAKTYFIGIGVAQYKDASMNLQYSAKDIRDLAKSFHDLYKDLVIDTFLDARATKENILGIKQKLMATDVNDRIILAITGHGLLNKTFDFYYATWDTDFKNPEERGVKYEDLEGLLN
ncbi:MAG: hypothetical protein EOO03_00815, partial [Chitinophagaceae bacterium]